MRGGINGNPLRRAHYVNEFKLFKRTLRFGIAPAAAITKSTASTWHHTHKQRLTHRGGIYMGSDRAFHAPTQTEESLVPEYTSLVTYAGEP